MSVEVAFPAVPSCIDVGIAPSVRVGSGAGTKFTVAVVLAVPPRPVQSSSYTVVASGVTTSVPDVVLLPLQPFEAVQDVESVELHVSVEVAVPAPGVTLVGFAERVTVGFGGALTVTVTA